MSQIDNELDNEHTRELKRIQEERRVEVEKCVDDYIYGVVARNGKYNGKSLKNFLLDLDDKDGPRRLEILALIGAHQSVKGDKKFQKDLAKVMKDLYEKVKEEKKKSKIPVTIKKKKSMKVEQEVEDKVGKKKSKKNTGNLDGGNEDVMRGSKKKSKETPGGTIDEEMNEVMNDLMMTEGLLQDKFHSIMPVKRTPDGSLEKILGYKEPAPIDKKKQPKKVDSSNKVQKKELKSKVVESDTLPTFKIILEATDFAGFEDWTKEKQVLAILNVSWAFLRETCKTDKNDELVGKDYLLEYALWNIRADWARDMNLKQKNAKANATKKMLKMFSLFINSNKDYQKLYKDMKKTKKYAPVTLKALQELYPVE